MSLITRQQETLFDLLQIKPGYLLYGRHTTWEEGKSGFVTVATEKKLTVQYHPGIGNITNHFFVPVSEVAAGEWEIRWSADLTKVWEYQPEETDKPEGIDKPEKTDKEQETDKSEETEKEQEIDKPEETEKEQETNKPEKGGEDEAGGTDI